ncbi:hypothetical protein B0T42_03065 [Rathayibacter sp. VKM Ac-2630]|nr:hypothetical protein B0T42_03065 [Rathayibacter sp. VKM Ac-2630]
MFESYLQNTTGPIVALVRSRLDFSTPPADRDRVQFVEVPNLVGGGRFGRKKDVVSFVNALSQAVDFSIIGADVMDGGYERREAVRRAQLLRIAASFGVPSRVLGFSWNAHSDVVARRELRRVSNSVELFARDPQSRARLQRERIRANESADIVFSLSTEAYPEDIAAWLNRQAGRVVSVNVSGLIMRKLDLVSEFAEVVHRLLAHGHKVILLPHVIRAGDNDLDACRQVAELLSDADRSEILLIERVLAPSEVAWVAEHSAVVLTGRMHFAILSLSQGTVPITMATQGKVEGLAELFGIEELVLSPERGVGATALELVEKVLASDEYRTKIVAALPVALELSSRSFSGLKTLKH